MKNQYNEGEFTIIVNSPGRINIIGEHTDYNNGFVLPTAIDKKVVFKLRKNSSKANCTIFSENLNENFQFSLSSVEPSNHHWQNYLLGVVYEIQQLTTKLEGFDCELKSDVPIGSGVSSSAAIECGLATGLNELFNLKLSKLEIIQLSQRAEHHFVGTKCGIMDQFASVMGKSNKAILLDCKSLNYEYIPIHLSPYKFLLLNSNVSHSLATSEYNIRRAECEKAVAIISKKYKRVNSLRDVSLEMLESCKPELPKVCFKRSKYVIEENTRVQKAVEALNQNHLFELGQLMYQTHTGLQFEYEVSCNEIDFLVEYTKKNKAVLGARMMGGGFGGCTINLIHENEIDGFVAEISAAYFKKFNIKLTSFEALPSEGTSVKFI